VTDIHAANEDVACADYLESLLQGHQPIPGPFMTRVRESVTGQLFLNPIYPELPADDLPCCTDLDRFDFAMLIRRKNDLLVMKPTQSPATAFHAPRRLHAMG
jgi:2-phosphosulfolactate phosphatase